MIDRKCYQTFRPDYNRLERLAASGEAAVRAMLAKMPKALNGLRTRLEDIGYGVVIGHGMRGLPVLILVGGDPGMNFTGDLGLY